MHDLSFSDQTCDKKKENGTVGCSCGVLQISILIQTKGKKKHLITVKIKSLFKSLLKTFCLLSRTDKES